VKWVMGQELNGSLGSWVTLSDPFPAVTGCFSYISSHLETNFTAQLTQEFEKRMRCVPRFNSPCHPQSTGLAERAVGNVKNIVFKLAVDHPKQWHWHMYGYVVS